MGESTEQLDASDAESLLSNRRRRYLLYCLHMYANPLKLPDIAHQVTVWERSDSPELCLKTRLKTYMSLYHEHLPKLEGADLVRYEQDGDMVALGPAADRIVPSLERQLRRDIDDLLGAEGFY